MILLRCGCPDPEVAAAGGSVGGSAPRAATTVSSAAPAEDPVRAAPAALGRPNRLRSITSVVSPGLPIRMISVGESLPAAPCGWVGSSLTAVGVLPRCVDRGRGDTPRQATVSWTRED